MYEQETIKPYDSITDKSNQVEEMFNNISSTYDRLNHRLSFDIDKIWRRKAIKELSKHRPQTILDVATGTGDFALLAAQETGAKKIIGVDIAENMLEIAKEKTTKNHLTDTISFKRDDCLNLSFTDNSFDAVISSFGIRNFADLEKGLKEIHRVLKPSGHLYILELTRPVSFPMKQLFKIYSHIVLPTYGALVSKDKAAYKYLTRTIEAFPEGEKMMQIFSKLHYSNAEFCRLTSGICTMYHAIK